MKIENLSTITLETEILHDKDVEGKNERKPAQFDFILGVASNGLSPFELALHDRSQGDTIECEVPGTKANDYFGQLYKRIFTNASFTIIPHSFRVKVHILSVRKSDEKEIVKAMARSLTHSCGTGSCDCGCN